MPSIRRPEFLEALGALPFKVGRADPEIIHVPLSLLVALEEERDFSSREALQGRE